MIKLGVSFDDDLKLLRSSCVVPVAPFCLMRIAHVTPFVPLAPMEKVFISHVDMLPICPSCADVNYSHLTVTCVIVN